MWCDFSLCSDECDIFLNVCDSCLAQNFISMTQQYDRLVDPKLNEISTSDCVMCDEFPFGDKFTVSNTQFVSPLLLNTSFVIEGIRLHLIWKTTQTDTDVRGLRTWPLLKDNDFSRRTLSY